MEPNKNIINKDQKTQNNQQIIIPQYTEQESLPLKSKQMNQTSINIKTHITRLLKSTLKHH